MRGYSIPNTELTVSRIGYGCMTLGGSWDDSQLTDDQYQLASRAVLTAAEQGMTLFDHADIYTRGKSELVFGKILRRNPGLRDRIVLQSKCGIRFRDDPQPGLPGRYDFSYEYIIRSVEGILSRLGVENLDILLLHRPDPLVEPEEVARAFDELHSSGKVRYFGVSNHTAAQIALLQQSLNQPLVVNQLQLSLIHAHLINDGVVANVSGGHYASAAGILDFCRLNGILVQAWGPLAGGQLTSELAETDERFREVAALIAQLAEEKQTSREAILLAWLLRHPAGIQPIVGTTRPERIMASVQADTIELSREEWYSLFVVARGGPLP